MNPKTETQQNENPSHKSIVQPLALAILLYIVAVGFLFGLYTVLVGLVEGGSFLFFLWETVLITISLLLPGYFLQQKTFELFDKSLLKSASVPILVWVPAIFIMTEFIAFIPNEDLDWTDRALLYLFVPSISFLTGLYISNRNTALFVVLLIIHCLAFSALRLIE